METDLEHLVKDRAIILMPEHIKNMVLQMLLGLEYLHLHWVLHRVGTSTSPWYNLS